MYKAKIKEYSKIVNLPYQPIDFVEHIKLQLHGHYKLVNDVLNDSENAEIKNGKLVLRKIKANNKHKDYKKLDTLLDNRIKATNLLDIIANITRKLRLHDLFAPSASGKVKMIDHLKQVAATIFSYGCNIGAKEAERTIIDVERKQIGRINAEHISEKSLTRAINKVIDLYNKFELPKIWGDGKHVSVDGTKWNTYSKNLMAQYHIRYRGYGGIAYYHVSNTYIALFSNFITCGVYEGRYLLDGLEENNTEIKPEYVHGDTHSQSFVIFALAYLLGIQVMPRIKNLQDLVFYKVNKTDNLGILNSILKEGNINWLYIEDNIEEMFRIAISIKEGKIKPSVFLNKLTYCGGRNKLYLGFRELGRTLRTIWLLKTISDFELRREVHSATCKSEEFNEFVNWIAFADNIIKSNHRIEQRKFIKYNHLVANIVMLHTVHEMSEVIKNAPRHGIQVTDELLRNFSPYRKEGIIRLGKYEMNVESFDTTEAFNWNFALKSREKPNS